MTLLVLNKEHILFLLYCPNQYFFRISSYKVTKEYILLAINLAVGASYALTPVMLTHLHCGMWEMVAVKMNRGLGPFWVLQLWLCTYFPKLSIPAINNTFFSYERLFAMAPSKE